MLALAVPTGACGLLDDEGCGEGYDVGEIQLVPSYELPDLGGPGEPHEPESEVDLDRCTEGLSAAEIDQALAIATAFEDHLGELPRVGTELRRLVAGLDDGVMLLGDEGTSLPEGFVSEGQGVFSRELQGLQEGRLEVRFHLARDYGFGGEGELVTADPFAMSSYLLDPVIVVDEEGGGYIVDHAGPGPLAELLGYEGQLPDPLPLSLLELGAFADGRLELDVEADVRLVSERVGGVIELEVKVPRRRSVSVIDGKPITMHQTLVAGANEVPGQTLAVHRWNLTQVTTDWGEAGLDGMIEARVPDGPFRFLAVYEYEETVEPSVWIRCG